MQLKEGQFYWWQARGGDEPKFCKIQKDKYSGGILKAYFFNNSRIPEPFWGIFTPAEVKPFKKEGCGYDGFDE